MELPTTDVECLSCGEALIQVDLQYDQTETDCPTHGREVFLIVYIACIHCGHRKRAPTFLQWVYASAAWRMN